MEISFGKYIFQDSFIHRIDGRIKFLAFFLILITIFLQNNFLPYLILLLFLIFSFWLAKIPVKNLIEILQTVLFMFCFLFFFNVINISDHNNSEEASKNILWEWSFLTLSWNGIFLTLYYTLRVFLVIFLTTILIATTRPKVLTFSIESLLLPLRWLRLPTHLFAIIVSLTLRLIPTLIEEARNIMEAQSSRGLDFKNSSWRVKFKVLISLLIPLLISIFKRADEMAIAMESRGYNPYGKRSNYHHFFLKKSDFFVLAFVCAIFIFLICLLYVDNNSLRDWFPNKWLLYQEE